MAGPMTDGVHPLPLPVVVASLESLAEVEVDPEVESQASLAEVEADLEVVVASLVREQEAVP